MTAGGNSGREKPLITIVNDDIRVCFAFTCVLESAGFECASFDSGDAFLAGYTTTAGCVLLDLMMPGIDGLGVLLEMQRRGWRTPVITLRSSDFDLVAQYSLEAGALTSVTLPVCSDKLIRAVINALVIDAWDARERAWRPAAQRRY